MARVAPTTGSKILYILCLIVGSLLLYIDINFKSFEGVKNNYKSALITSSYLTKTLIIDPFVYMYELSKMKSTLIDENKQLKRELDESYLSNFIISRETKFFSDNSSIEKLLDFYNLDKVFYLSEIKYFDTEKYFCCDQHRLFIQSVTPSKKNFTGRQILICREMSKFFEEFIRSSVDDLKEFNQQLKGELTIVISDKDEKKKASQELSESDKKNIKSMIKKLSIKEITSLVYLNSKVSKKKIYNYCLKLKNEM